MDGENNLLVASSVSQVGKGAENPFTEGGSAAEMPHRGKITISMKSISSEVAEIQKHFAKKFRTV